MIRVQPDNLVRRNAVAAFGEKLKKTRENKKMTLDDVAVSTKISVRMLRALEEEKFAQLPGGVFNKGFVRAYARHLGLDEERTIAEYVAASGGAPVPSAEDAELRAIAERKEKERQNRPAAEMSWGWVAIVLLVVALGLSVWGFYSREKQNTPRTVGKRETAPAASNAPTGSAQAPSPAADAGTGTAAATDAENTPASTSPVAAEPATTTAAAGVQDTAYPASFTVLVKANEDSWLTVTADTKVLFQDTLSAAAEKSISAQKQVVLRAGNVGGLDIFFNGKKVPAQGEPGEAKTLTFGQNGLESSAAAAH